jgi:hypothetical protein
MCADGLPRPPRRYRPRIGRWMVQAVDEDGEVTFITCGDSTLEQVWERTGFLRLDDRIYGAAGEPRKYQ